MRARGLSPLPIKTSTPSLGPPSVVPPPASLPFPVRAGKTGNDLLSSDRYDFPTYGITDSQLRVTLSAGIGRSTCLRE